MTTIAEALPMLGLRISAGPLEMRGIDGAGAMPFYVPWSIAPAEVLPTRFAQYHWMQRAELSVLVEA